MTDSRVLDVDEAAAVGLQHVARVELREAVGAHDLPVRPTRQDLAAMFGPSNVPPRMGMMRRRPRGTLPSSVGGPTCTVSVMASESFGG